MTTDTLEPYRQKVLNRLSHELGSKRMNFHGQLRLVSKLRRHVRRHTELGDLLVRQVSGLTN